MSSLRKRLEKLICDWRATALYIYRNSPNEDDKDQREAADYYCTCADQLEAALEGKRDEEKKQG